MELFVLVIALGLGGLALALVLMRNARPAPGTPEAQLAVVVERLTAVSDRLGALEQRQESMRDGLQRLDSSLAQTSSLTSGLKDSAEAIRGDLVRTREHLAQLQESTRTRQAQDEEAMRALHRLEQVIAGTASKGGAGENIVDLVFARLPAEWQVRDLRVGNRVVEFGLRLPNGLVLPIDSKWPATNLIESLATATDDADRQRLKAQVEQVVLDKAREASKYLHPELTAGFAIAVVPDAVDEVCGALKAECLRLNVALVGYSLFLPYLLIVFQLALRAGASIDIERLAAHVDAAAKHAASLQEEVEGRLSRALTMLGNSRDELRMQSARLTLSLSSIRAPVAEALPADGVASYSSSSSSSSSSS